MNDTSKPAASISLPSDFRFGEVPPAHPPGLAPRISAPAPPDPDLGPLAAFQGSWTGKGFNTIFRPDNPVTQTTLALPPVAGDPLDNILELNLTLESLVFSPSLGSVPNRGSGSQGDVFLNGVPYLQTVQDVSNPARKIGIHVEPGLWIIVPPTTSPAEGMTLCRMASIPHGTTIQAQGTSSMVSGPPTIPTVDITPFATGNPTAKIPFRSQKVVEEGTRRIPQDLTSFINDGAITQALLDDPNTLLRNLIALQKILSTTQIDVSTQPNAPLFGGGSDNIAFLQGDNGTPAPAKPNAQTLLMTATFWIETVQETITIPPFTIGQPALSIQPAAKAAGQPVPTFSVTPPMEITAPRVLIVTYTQIQYSQVVLLNFNGLSWPHVSVATLVPTDEIVVPASAWE